MRMKWSSIVWPSCKITIYSSSYSSRINVRISLALQILEKNVLNSGSRKERANKTQTTRSPSGRIYGAGSWALGVTSPATTRVNNNAVRSFIFNNREVDRMVDLVTAVDRISASTYNVPDGVGH